MKISRKEHSNHPNNCISNPSIEIFRRKPQQDEPNKVPGVLEQASDAQVPAHRLEYRIQHALHKAREFNDKKAYKPYG